MRRDEHARRWPRQHAAEVALRRAQAPSIEEYERKLEESRALHEAIADAYDMTVSPHRGSLFRSVLESPPSADEAGGCVEPFDQDAVGHTSKPKPIGEFIGEVNPMEKHYPKGINAVGHQEWKNMPFPMLVDSGAADTILPSSWFNDHKMVDSEGSLQGAFYMSAAGQPILNEGERTLAMITGDAQMRKMTFQVAKTTKALASVSKIVGNGNVVVFDADGSYILNKQSGEVTWLREENGVYLLDVQVAPPGWTPEQGIPEAVASDPSGRGKTEGAPSSAPFVGQGR